MYDYEFSIQIITTDITALNFLLAMLIVFAVIWVYKLIASLIVGG